MRNGRQITRAILIPLLLGGTAAAAKASPTPQESMLVEPADRGIGSLETIRIVTRWDAPGYEIEPDFSALDGGLGGSTTIVDSANGTYLILHSTGPMTGLEEASEIPVPITARDPSDGSSFTDQTLEVCRRHLSAPPEPLVTTIRGDTTRFHSGDSLIVESLWRVSLSTQFWVTPDYRALVPSFRTTEPRITEISRDTISADLVEIGHEVAYRIPGITRLVPEGDGIPLAILGQDGLCSAIRAPELLIDLRTTSPPSPVEQRVVSPAGRGVREGDTVEILSRWDAGGYLLRADFSELDGGAGGAAAVIDSSVIDSAAIGSYLIRYTPGSMAGRPDAAVTVPITAVDSLGDTFTDRTLQVCRNQSTPPPVHLESWIRGGRRKYRNTDSLVIYSRWTHPAGLPLTVEADFRNIAPDFQLEDATVSHRGVDTFLVLYRLPATSQLVPDGERIPLRLMARDSLCSLTTYDSLTIDLDTEPPPEPPTFFPFSSNETNTSPVLFSGLAIEAARVAVFRNDELQGRADVGEDDRFEMEVELVPGANKIGGYAEDDIGNKTIFGSSLNILYVESRSTSYPTPFRRNDEIVIDDAGGIREARVQIYNLEGDVVARFESEGSTLEVVFAWDGTDLDGHPAQPGYYLMRIRTVGVDGKADEELLPMLFRND